MGLFHEIVAMKERQRDYEDNKLREIKAKRQEVAQNKSRMGISMMDKSYPMPMRKKGMQMFRSGLEVLFPQEDFSSFDKVSLDTKEGETFLTRIQAQVKRIEKDGAPVDSMLPIMSDGYKEYEDNAAVDIWKDKYNQMSKQKTGTPVEGMPGFVSDPKGGATRVTGQGLIDMEKQIFGNAVPAFRGTEAYKQAVVGWKKGTTFGKTGEDVLYEKSAKDLAEKRGTTQSLIDLGRKIIDAGKANPASLGFTGGTIKMIDSLASQMVAASNLARQYGEIDGVQVPESALLNPNLYKEELGLLKGAAAKSAGLRSNIIKLAYINAKAMDPGGRLAKDDVQLSLKAIAGGTGSPEQLEASITETVNSAIGDYGNMHKANRNLDAPKGTFDLKGFGEMDGGVLNVLPPGSKVVGTISGKKVYETKDGQRFVEE